MHSVRLQTGNIVACWLQNTVLIDSSPSCSRTLCPQTTGIRTATFSTAISTFLYCFALFCFASLWCEIVSVWRWSIQWAIVLPIDDGEFYIIIVIITYLLTLLTYLLSTYLPTYLLTYLFTYLPTYLLSYLLFACLLTYFTYFHTYLVTCLLACLLTLLTYFLSYLLTYILTYLLLTAFEFSLGGSSPSVVEIKQIMINIHKRNNTKTQCKQYKVHFFYIHCSVHHYNCFKIITNTMTLMD